MALATISFCLARWRPAPWSIHRFLSFGWHRLFGAHLSWDLPLLGVARGGLVPRGRRLRLPPPPTTARRLDSRERERGQSSRLAALGGHPLGAGGRAGRWSPAKAWAGRAAWGRGGGASSGAFGVGGHRLEREVGAGGRGPLRAFHFLDVFERRELVLERREREPGQRLARGQQLGALSPLGALDSGASFTSSSSGRHARDAEVLANVTPRISGNLSVGAERGHRPPDRFRPGVICRGRRLVAWFAPGSRPLLLFWCKFFGRESGRRPFPPAPSRLNARSGNLLRTLSGAVAILDWPLLPPLVLPKMPASTLFPAALLDLGRSLVPFSAWSIMANGPALTPGGPRR